MLNFIALFSLVVAHAAPSASDFTVCGLKGSLKKRIESCAKAYGEKATHERIALTDEAVNVPLAGIDGEYSFVWKLVASFAKGQQVWYNEKAGLFWYNMNQSLTVPAPAFMLSDALEQCNKAQLKLSRYLTIRFDLPNEATWADALKQGSDLLSRSGIEYAVGYARDGQLVGLGRPQADYDINVVCFGYIDQE